MTNFSIPAEENILPMGGPTTVADNAINLELPSSVLNKPQGTAYRPLIGTDKALPNSAPNTMYKYTTSNGKRVSDYFYNDAGKVEFQIDYRPTNGVWGPGHGHYMSTPGNFNSGHLPANHVPFSQVPNKYWGY